MITFNGVNHLAMATGDMDKTIRFWRDLLGMRLVAGLGQPGYRHYFFQISETDLLAFFEWPGVQPVTKKEHGRPVGGPFIFDHVSFGVETEDDLWELKDKLETAEFPVSDVIDHGFIHSIYAHDPNGIPIEFSHNVEGADIRRNPQMKDKTPTSAAMKGAGPQPGVWPAVTRLTPASERIVYPGAGSELFHGKKTSQETPRR
ncbi:MAG: VOC family protein [Chloroflexi bacterium]|nr:VOC family protein [Chloroflexota bacterium]